MLGIRFSQWETNDQDVQSLVLALSNEPKREGASLPLHTKSLLQFSVISRYRCTKLQSMCQTLSTVFCPNMNKRRAHHTHNRVAVNKRCDSHIENNITGTMIKPSILVSVQCHNLYFPCFTTLYTEQCASNLG